MVLLSRIIPKNAPYIPKNSPYKKPVTDRFLDSNERLRYSFLISNCTHFLMAEMKIKWSPGRTSASKNSVQALLLLKRKVQEKFCVTCLLSDKMRVDVCSQHDCIRWIYPWLTRYVTASWTVICHPCPVGSFTFVHRRPGGTLIVFVITWTEKKIVNLSPEA